ncbi:hypothetical protein FHT09_001078 [Xanthomonas arboricola]|uniref:hypothetical protein n=1 Tax=Xanthomonas TaxID=338 RepID=UPI0011B0DAAE|nr:MULTISPECIES: hypothetical protein [Xanthomonas]MBB5735379.1 hypothetical protein [Xanthomonas sp. CFBP 8152]
MKTPACIAALLLLVSVIGSSQAQVKMCGTETSAQLPSKTTSRINPDGSMTIRVPTDWFMFTQEKGVWAISPTAVLTCACPGGSGCSPTLLPNGQTFCAMSSDCTQCNRGGSTAMYPVRQDQIGATFASADEVRSLPRIDARLLSVPDVRKDLLAFKKTLDIPVDASGRDAVWIRLYGYVAPMDVPDGYQIPMTGSATENMALGLLASQSIQVPSAAVKCSCASGGSCKLESNFGVKVCNAAACATCSMTY